MWRDGKIQRGGGFGQQVSHPAFGRMRNHVSLRTWTMPLALLALAITFSSNSKAQKSSSPNADLPAGAMQAKATTACTECHEARIILQQRLSKAAWSKEVDKMTKWWAVVDAADRDALIEDFSANFAPEK